MKNLKFRFSFIFIILGICIITISKIAEEIVPIINLTLNYWIGALCILGGAFYLIKNSDFIKNQLNALELRNKEFEEQRKNIQNE